MCAAECPLVSDLVRTTGAAGVARGVTALKGVWVREAGRFEALAGDRVSDGTGAGLGLGTGCVVLVVAVVGAG